MTNTWRNFPLGVEGGKGISSRTRGIDRKLPTGGLIRVKAKEIDGLTSYLGGETKMDQRKLPTEGLVEVK